MKKEDLTLYLSDAQAAALREFQEKYGKKERVVRAMAALKSPSYRPPDSVREWHALYKFLSGRFLWDEEAAEIFATQVKTAYLLDQLLWAADDADWSYRWSSGDVDPLIEQCRSHLESLPDHVWQHRVYWPRDFD